MMKKIIILTILILLLAGGYFYSNTAEKKGFVTSNNSIPESNFILPATDNIVFLVIDTLRADHLPFYGYDVDTAPFLSSLASKSVVFENAFSASSTTAPAMASVFTSVYPSQHGVVMGMQATKRLVQMQNKSYQDLSINKIPANLLTLGEMMKERGFKTYGVADNLNIDHQIGYIEGFDRFQTFPYEGAPKINQVAESYFPDLDNTRHFLYLHYMDPHIPYHQREPWFDETHPNQKIAAYDSEIRYADEHIKEIFEKYRVLDNSLVVFLSDHGEELGDHGDYGHGRNLFPEVIRVPLFIYHRNLNPARVKQPVHTIDVLPTLADVTQAKSMSYWEGKSLTPYFEDASYTTVRTTFSQLLGPKEYVRELFLAGHDQDHWLYIDSVTQQRKELFKLIDDPLAQEDLFLVYPNKSIEIGAEVDQLLDRGAIGETEKVDIKMNKKTINKLKTLGYF